METSPVHPYPGLREPDHLIMAGEHGATLCDALLSASEVIPDLPLEQQYAYLHLLADRCQQIQGMRDVDGYRVFARTGIESKILDKIFELPGIDQQPDKQYETCVRQLKCLHRDYGDVYRATGQPSYRNELRIELSDKRRQYALRTRALMRETGRYDAHIDYLAALALRRGRIRRVETVEVSSRYL